MALPKVGLVARLLLSEYKKQVREYERETKKINAVTKKVATETKKSSQLSQRYFDDFVQKVAEGGKLMDNALSNFFNSLTELPGLWEKIGRPEIDIDKFTQLANSGNSIEDAFMGAAVQSEGFSISLKQVATIVGITTAAITAMIAAIRKSINEYTEFVTEMRKLQLVMGTTSTETAAWAKLVQDSGTQVSTLVRGVSFLERQITDLKLRQIEGKEASTQFSRALDALNISWQDSAGNMRGADAVMRDVITRIQKLGPSSEASALALRLFGRAGARDMLPMLFDSIRTLEETELQARRLGVTMTEVDKKNLQQWRLSTSDLNDATKGLGLTIAREFLPELTKLADKLVQVINGVRQGFAAISAADLLLRRTVKVGFKQAREEAQEYYNYLVGVIPEAQQKQEDLAKAQRQAAIDALFEAEAQEELAKQLSALNDELGELNEQYTSKRADIDIRFDQRLEDIQRKRDRDQVTRGIKLGNKMEELWIKNQQNLAKIRRSQSAELEKIDDKRDEKLRELARAAQKKREDLELKHQERLWKIQNKYLDTIQEAARKNDAVAVVKAMRVRQRALRDAERQRQVEGRDLGRDLAEKRRKINEDAAQKKQERQTQEQEKVAEENIRYAQELARLRRQTDEQRTLRKLRYRWEEEDLNIAKQRQLDALDRWFWEERLALEEQIANLGVTAAGAVAAAGNDIAAAAAQAVGQVASAAVGATGTAGMAEAQQRMRREFAEADRASYAGSTTAIDAWRRRRPQYRAEGGLDVVSKSTSFVAGERGPEALLSVPLSGQMNVRHQFSRLPVEFSGAPQGMDAGSVNSMLWNILTQFGQQLLGEE